MCKSVSSSSVHGTDMSLHWRLDEQTVLVTAVIVVFKTVTLVPIQTWLPMWIGFVFLLPLSSCASESITVKSWEMAQFSPIVISLWHLILQSLFIKDFSPSTKCASLKRIISAPYINWKPAQSNVDFSSMRKIDERSFFPILLAFNTKSPLRLSVAVLLIFK